MNKIKTFFFEADTLVMAGAGTGKTHALVTQYLHLCAHLTAHEELLAPEKIVVLTFTDKAAFELKERITQRIQQLGSKDDIAQFEPELYESAVNLGRKIPPKEFWRNTQKSIERAPIGTFHALSHILLRKNSAVMGLDAAFTLLNEEEAALLSELVGHKFILSALSNPKSAELISEYGGKSGITQFVQILFQVISKRREQGLEMEGMAEQMLSMQAQWPVLAPLFFESLADLAQCENDVGPSSRKLLDVVTAVTKQIHSKESIIADQDFFEKAQLIQESVSKIRSRITVESAALVAAAKEKFKESYDPLRSLYLSAQYEERSKRIERFCVEIHRAYQIAKNERQSLDFTDLLVYFRNLLRDSVEAQEKIRQDYHVFLLDEMQDTNLLQMEILSFLLYGNAHGLTTLFRTPSPEAADRTTQNRAGRLYIVGDRKQSIYEFRGANVDSFERVCEQLLLSGAHLQALRVSRRAVPQLIQFTNSLFSRVFQEPSSTGTTQFWQEEIDALEPYREQQDENSAAILLVSNQEQRGESSIRREATMLAHKIKSLYKNGIDLSNIAILLRRYTHLHEYTHALDLADVPYTIVKGRGFYQTQEVRDLALAMMCLFDADRALIFALLRSPFCGLLDETLFALKDRIDLSYNKLLQDLPQLGLSQDEEVKLKDCCDRMLQLKEIAERIGPRRCIELLYEQFDLAAIWICLPQGKQRIANIEELILRAHQFERLQGSTRRFSTWLWQKATNPTTLDLMTPQPTASMEHNASVRIMTIHQSKGLEFPIVFIPGCAGSEYVQLAPIDYLPSLGLGFSVLEKGRWEKTYSNMRIWQQRKQRAEAESKRLFYVAVTRAKDRVYFLGESARSSKKSWRSFLDQFLQSEAASLLSTEEI